jgi:hypothetical protein
MIMVKLYPEKYNPPTKEELQQLSDNYHAYAEEFLERLDKLERQSRESRLVVKLALT